MINDFLSECRLCAKRTATPKDDRPKALLCPLPTFPGRTPALPGILSGCKYRECFLIDNALLRFFIIVFVHNELVILMQISVPLHRRKKMGARLRPIVTLKEKHDNLETFPNVEGTMKTVQQLSNTNINDNQAAHHSDEQHI